MIVEKAQRVPFYIFRHYQTVEKSQVGYLIFRGLCQKLAFLRIRIRSLGVPNLLKERYALWKFLELRLLLVLGINIDREVKVMNHKESNKRINISHTDITQILSSIIIWKTKSAFIVSFFDSIMSMTLHLIFRFFSKTF